VTPIRKNFYSKQTAFGLANAGLGIKPLLIEIKQYNVQPLKQFVSFVLGKYSIQRFTHCHRWIDGSNR
jgi:hypothetical protein